MQIRTSPWMDKLQYILQSIPYLGIIASIGTIILFAYLEKWDVLPYALTLLIPTILVSVFYIWRKRSIVHDVSSISDFCNSGWINLKQSTLIKIFCIIFCITIIWLLIGGSRDAVFIVLGVLLYSTAILQIFLCKMNGKLVALQLVAAALVFILSSQFCYYLYNEGGDCLFHMVFGQGIASMGYIDPLVYPDYAKFPLLHIILAVANILSTVPITHVIWISISIPLTITAIFVYYITESITKSERLSALSVFLFLIIPVVMTYFAHGTPRTLAAAAFLIILYLLFRFKDDSNLIPVWILGIITSVYMLLVHHAQTILIYAILTILLISFLIYGKKFSWTQKGIAVIPYVILGIMIPYLSSWIQSLSKLLDKQFFGVLDEAFSADAGEGFEAITQTPAPTLIPTASTSIPTIHPTPIPTTAASGILEKVTATVEVQSTSFGIQQIIHLWSAILILIAILFGLFYLVHQKNRFSAVTALWPFTLIFFALFTPYVAEAFMMIQNMEQIGRLQILLAPIFAVIMAIGVVVLGYLVYKMCNRPVVGKVVMIAFCILLVIASPVMNNCRDSSLFAGNEMFPQSTNYFTEPEVASFTFIEDYSAPYTGLYSDYGATRYFMTSSATAKIGKPAYKFPSGTLELFTEEGASLQKGGVMIFREGYYLNNDGMSVTLYGGNNVGRNTVVVKNTERNYGIYCENTYNTNMIYDDSSVKIQREAY